jgi:hypothetical protein
MKKFFVLVLLITAFFIWLNRNNSSAPSAAKSKAPTESPRSAVQTKPQPVYEHDWAKHSLDRASEVADQVRKTRKENEQP